MKVNMNQIPDDDKKSQAKASSHTDFLKKKAVEPEQETDVTEEEPADSEEESSSGNVYAEALKDYRDKWKEQSKKGNGILQNNKFWIVVCVILFLMFVFANSKIGGTKTRYLSQIKRINTEATNLQDAVEELRLELEEQAKIDAIKLTEEEEELARTMQKPRVPMWHIFRTNTAAFQRSKTSLNMKQRMNGKKHGMNSRKLIMISRLNWLHALMAIPGYQTGSGIPAALTEYPESGNS